MIITYNGRYFVFCYRKTAIIHSIKNAYKMEFRSIVGIFPSMSLDTRDFCKELLCALTVGKHYFH